MDTSEQYINMCRKATELQEIWKPTLGDFYYSDFSKLVCVMSDHMQFNRDKLKEYSDAIWLPRIDQLIFLLNKESPYWTQFYGFELFRRIADAYDRDRRPGTSEHRILELIYIEKYNKSWDGKDWI